MSMKEKLNEIVYSPYFVRHILFFIALGLYTFWIFYRSGNTKYPEALTGLVNVRATHVSVFWWCFLYIVVFHLIYTYICFGRGGYRAMWSDAPVVYGYIFFFMFQASESVFELMGINLQVKQIWITSRL